MKKYLNNDHLIPGDFYVWEDDKDRIVIFRYTDASHNEWMCPSSGTYMPGGIHNIGDKNHRRATLEEIEHFEQCERAYKYVEYVPVPQSIDNYNIF
jgi:hypothetical protein